VKFSVREYLTADGRGPYREWLETLDRGVRARVQARVLRFEQGNLGDHKSVGQGVLEARLTFGPGYRIYFGMHGSTVVLLLLGGDKGSQVRNIQAAKRHWSDFVEAMKDGKAK
jgi:putative addiction module killer protein